MTKTRRAGFSKKRRRGGRKTVKRRAVKRRAGSRRSRGTKRRGRRRSRGTKRRGGRKLSCYQRRQLGLPCYNIYHQGPIRHKIFA